MMRKDYIVERQPLLGEDTFLAEHYDYDLDNGEVLPEDQTAAVVKHRFNFDEAVNYIGLGKFHLLLILICGWANASDAVEVMCLSLVLPSATCELQLKSYQLGWLTAGMFVGMMCGGYLWGGLSDAIGRRNVLFFALLLNGLFGVFSSFSQSFWVLLMCRIISGIGVGGSVPVVWSYFVEFTPNSCRGRMLSCLAAFWMVGQLVVTGFAWIIIPRTELAFYLGDMRFPSWRIFLILATFTSLTSAFLVFLLPPSPKFLLQKGQHEEALDVFRRIYKMNNHSDKEFAVTV